MSISPVSNSRPMLSVEGTVGSKRVIEQRSATFTIGQCKVSSMLHWNSNAFLLALPSWTGKPFLTILYQIRDDAYRKSNGGSVFAVHFWPSIDSPSACCKSGTRFQIAVERNVRYHVLDRDFCNETTGFWQRCPIVFFPYVHRRATSLWHFFDTK